MAITYLLDFRGHATKENISKILRGAKSLVKRENMQRNGE